MKLLLSLLLSFIVITVNCQTYYIVRHAEKMQPSAGNTMATPDNPPLTEAGTQRAQALKDYLKDKKIGYIYSTNTLRTTSTVKPLAELSGINIIYYKKADQQFVDSLAILGRNVLIVGHSNTVDDIVNLLCKAQKVPGDLEDSQYDNLYVVTIKGNDVSFSAIKYGKASQ